MPKGLATGHSKNKKNADSVLVREIFLGRKNPGHYYMQVHSYLLKELSNVSSENQSLCTLELEG